MMCQAITEVSVALDEVIVNDVAAVRAVTAIGVATATVPRDWTVRNIRELAVTTVVLTVTVPSTSVATPIDALLPSLISSLLPAVTSVRLPNTDAPVLVSCSRSARIVVPVVVV